MQHAEHILGFAHIEVDTADYVTGERDRTVISGDLGAPCAALLPALRTPYRADILVIESTYGDRCHEGRQARRERLKAAIDWALENVVSVVIPAFSIGRVQELLYEL